MGAFSLNPTGSTVWFVLFEGLLALALFIFIVWWTLPKKPKDKPGDGDGRE
ncbi:MAG TPA: hypothetical protein VLW45_11905 [Pelomicrobium sp.]|nr:hypothetical protein [Pelomicrobium sp.]